MKKHSCLLEEVKEVLTNEQHMQKISQLHQGRIDEIFQDPCLKVFLRELIAQGEYAKKKCILIPTHNASALEYLNNITNEHGQAEVEALKLKESCLSNHNDELKLLIQARVEYMLTFVASEKLEIGVTASLEEYEKALSVNKKGYSIHYKRDVDEIMVNTYNEEWIQAWNGNMDFQLCLDYFAVITYISDYYCKDDTGTMQVLQEALRESMHEDLRSRLKKMVSVFLTHRQMGESEAYYRILPSMHLKDSDCKTVFAQTGFEPSRYLERIDEKDLDRCEKVVEVTGRTGKYQEKPSLYDKYLRRDCKKQPNLRNLCYAQFVKRYQSCGSVTSESDLASKTVQKENQEKGEIDANHIISKDYDDLDHALELPMIIALIDLKPGELPYMKRRSAQALRFHKFNKEKNPHEYYYSELQLYLPHTASKGCNLIKEKESLEVCRQTYIQSEVFKVKSRIMPYLESVEEGLEITKMQNSMGDELDPQNEQDEQSVKQRAFQIIQTSFSQIQGICHKNVRKDHMGCLRLSHWTQIRNWKV